MEKTEASKTRLLALLQIFQENSDPLHPLPSQALCELLRAQGLALERKTLGRDIAALQQAGYQICYQRSIPRGYYLANRSLEPAQVRLLLDAVCSAAFITPSMTQQLTQRLCATLSKHQAACIRAQVFPVAKGRHKFDNEEIYDTISAIMQALQAGEQLRFVYYHTVLRNGRATPDTGRTFIVSPYALLWHSDRYYLVANYGKYDTVSSYRLDRMREALVINKPVRPFSDVTPYQERFDAADYMARSFYMFHGDPEVLQLRCTRDLLDVLLDQFGSALELIEASAEDFIARVQVNLSEGLYEWLLQYGARLEVLQPARVREEMCSRLQRTVALYTSEGSDMRAAHRISNTEK